MLEAIQTYFSQAPAFGFNAFWISQGLVLIAFVFALLSFQFKERKLILINFIASLFLIGLHFYLLDLQAAAWLFWLGMARYIIGLFSTARYWIYLFSLAAIALFIINFKSHLEWLVLIGNLIFIYAGFQEQDKKLRELNFAAGIIYLVYLITVLSPAMVLLEAFFLASNAIGYYRFYLKKA